MKCENAQQNIILAQYGELPDELQFALEQHLTLCEKCRREWNATLALQEELAKRSADGAFAEPAGLTSRMRLDEALDAMPERNVGQRFWGNAFRWVGFMQGAPALTTLLMGVGFIGGNFVARYQAASVAKLPTPVIVTSPSGGSVASVSRISNT